MEWLNDVLALFQGYLYLPMNPFFYLAIVALWIQYKRQMQIERDMFGLRIHSVADQMLRTILFGCMAGMIGTVFISVFSIAVSSTDLLLIWIVSVLLSLFHIRYLCFAYAGGLIGFLSICLKFIHPPAYLPAVGMDIWNALRDVSAADLLALVALLHILEALLVWLQGSEGALPVFVEGRRGKIVGGFVLQKFWLVPMVSFVGVMGQTHGLAGDAGAYHPFGIQLLSFPHVFTAYHIAPFPVMLGYSTWTLTKNTKQKVKQSAGLVAVYGICLLALVELGLKYPILLLLASICSIVVHEWIILFDNKQERMGAPIYIKPLKGLKLLAVLSGTPAEIMGLQAGDTIVRVNGIPVNTPYDFHFAISQNPAYVKLDVLDERGELRLAGKPLYAGDHHQLGVILVPDETALQYVVLYPANVWSVMKRLFHTKRADKRGQFDPSVSSQM
ncbi:PDZ domain-containing protein [Fodinisporobacter ferrooxydans]|uniref:PDZ domain-containing protein n=1 Tax=Fodinisporobacter ferrooxydans TaxID=2901836 RepID=A0ABY4CLL8_9BACL|nr:PDZ domain-containing protein [Alicyclobacillaceae bacterium MYW30-H2]